MGQVHRGAAKSLPRHPINTPGPWEQGQCCLASRLSPSLAMLQVPCNFSQKGLEAYLWILWL